MIKKTITFMFVLLMVSSIFMTPQTTNTSTLGFAPEQKSQVAETDLDRVTWVANVAPNRDFESWDTPKYPENLAASRTTEEATWIETTIFSEGTQSIGMHARALDSSHSSFVTLNQGSQSTWYNPINTTLDLDWYLDEIGNPINEDYFSMRVRMGSRNMYYYLGCNTTATNGTYAYFFIDGPTKVWNHFHRNLTSDYIAVFGGVPTDFETIYWYVQSYTTDITRVYMDDVNLVNSSHIAIGPANDGDFEMPGGSGHWSFDPSYDPADVTQSLESHGGSWSMNMTAISYDYLARANVQATVEKRLSDINQAQLSFWWRIDDWINSASSTLAYMRVSAQNATDSLTMYYYLCVGGAGTLPPESGDDLKFKADSFNVTDTWNFFECNIWEDYHAYYRTNDLWIQNIEFYVSASNDDSRISLLFDDMAFTASIMNDMDYETQAAVGSTIQGWTEPNDDEKFTVTDFAYTGTKAANMTLEDDDDFSYERELGNIVIDDTTELIFDFNVYIDTFNETAEDFIFFEFGFDDGHTICYVIANSSSEFEGWIGEESNFIILKDEIAKGQWLNYQLDLVHDYESLTGSLPDTALDHVYFVALASKTNRLTVFLDDVYIYYDPAPGVSDVGHEPATPVFNDFITVTATVVDATLESVVLYYRVDNGTWMTQAMSQLDNSPFLGSLTNLSVDSVVEYYITATDAFGKTTNAMNGTDYFSFVVAPEGFPWLAVVAISATSVIVVLILLYMFIFMKKKK